MAGNQLADEFVRDSRNRYAAGPVDEATGKGVGWRAANVASGYGDAAVVIYGPDGNPLTTLASTVADGADVNAGSTADNVVAAGATGSMSAKLRRLTTDLSALLGRFSAARLAADDLSLPTGPDVLATSLLYDGTNLDLQRANTVGTALVSAARTGSVLSADLLNPNARGVHAILDVTAASGTGGLQLQIIGKDPVSGSYPNLTALPTAVTATGVYVYALYPGIGAASAAIVGATSRALPRVWQIGVTHGDGSSYTYSVGYALIL